MRKKQVVSYAQRQLPFSGTDARTLVSPFKREWQAIALASILVIGISALYGTFLVRSIAEVSLRESAVRESRALGASLATAESEFLNKTRGITPSYARALGYTESGNRVFVSRHAAVSYALTDASR